MRITCAPNGLQFRRPICHLTSARRWRHTAMPSRWQCWLAIVGLDDPRLSVKPSTAVLDHGLGLRPPLASTLALRLWSSPHPSGRPLGCGLGRWLRFWLGVGLDAGQSSWVRQRLRSAAFAGPAALNPTPRHTLWHVGALAILVDRAIVNDTDTLCHRHFHVRPPRPSGRR
jgi:hypothetical protein